MQTSRHDLTLHRLVLVMNLVSVIVWFVSVAWNRPESYWTIFPCIFAYIGWVIWYSKLAENNPSNIKYLDRLRSSLCLPAISLVLLEILTAFIVLVLVS